MSRKKDYKIRRKENSEEKNIGKRKVERKKREVIEHQCKKNGILNYF